MPPHRRRRQVLLLLDLLLVKDSAELIEGVLGVTAQRRDVLRRVFPYVDRTGRDGRFCGVSTLYLENYHCIFNVPFLHSCNVISEIKPNVPLSFESSSKHFSASLGTMFNNVEAAFNRTYPSEWDKIDISCCVPSSVSFSFLSVDLILSYILFALPAVSLYPHCIHISI